MNSTSSTSIKKPICILVMGGPASGKGTNCAMLAKEFGLIHLSIGDVLREERQYDTEEGKFLDYHMKEFEKSGKLMPSEVVAQFLFKAMMDKGWEQNIYLIDGFIKAMPGLKCWDAMFSEIVEMRFILYLECSEDTMYARMTNRSKTSGRLDDNEKIFETRIKTFFSRTYPCIEEMEKSKVVMRVSSEIGSIEDVYEEVKKAFLLFFPELSK